MSSFVHCFMGRHEAGWGVVSASPVSPWRWRRSCAPSRVESRAFLKTNAPPKIPRNFFVACLLAHSFRGIPPKGGGVHLEDCAQEDSQHKSFDPQDSPIALEEPSRAPWGGRGPLWSSHYPPGGWTTRERSRGKVLPEGSDTFPAGSADVFTAYSQSYRQSPFSRCVIGCFAARVSNTPALATPHAMYANPPKKIDVQIYIWTAASPVGREGCIITPECLCSIDIFIVQILTTVVAIPM